MVCGVWSDICLRAMAGVQTRLGLEGVKNRASEDGIFRENPFFSPEIWDCPWVKPLLLGSGLREIHTHMWC